MHNNRDKYKYYGQALAPYVILVMHCKSFCSETNK